jgi:hypothetical protein
MAFSASFRVLADEGTISRTESHAMHIVGGPAIVEAEAINNAG